MQTVIEMGVLLLPFVAVAVVIGLEVKARRDRRVIRRRLTGGE